METLPITDNLDKKNKDFFKKPIFEKNSSDDEAGPSKKRIKVSSSNDLFDGFDISSLEWNDLIETQRQLNEEINKPSSSKDDKSILENKLKAIQEELNKKINENFLSETDIEEVGLLDLDTASDDEIKQAIKEINDRRSLFSQDSEEYERLLERESMYEDALAIREFSTPKRSPSPSSPTQSEPNPDSKEKGKGKQIEKD
jgi:hypothetical protein